MLVNNAGNFYAGFFEEITPEDFRAQVETNLFGPLNVTRAVLPVMRAQRSGLVVTITSTAGLIGQEFCSAYAASKFALEGFMESLAPRSRRSASARWWSSPGSSAPTCYPESTRCAEFTIDDYTERTKQTVEAWNGMNGRQGGDPAKLATALIQLATSEEPPVRWVAGADAVAPWNKANDLLAQVDAHRDLSSALFDDTTAYDRHLITGTGRGMGVDIARAGRDQNVSEMMTMTRPNPRCAMPGVNACASHSADSRDRLHVPPVAASTSTSAA